MRSLKALKHWQFADFQLGFDQSGGQEWGSDEECLEMVGHG